METHVKVLAVLYIVFGALGVFGAFAIMAVFGVAGLAIASGLHGDPNAAMALPIIGLTGTALAVFLLVVSLPGLIGGIGLLKYRPWARIVIIVVSAINLIHFPLGTILGVYGLWVMFTEQGARLFTAAPPTLTT